MPHLLAARPKCSSSARTIKEFSVFKFIDIKIVIKPFEFNISHLINIMIIINKCNFDTDFYTAGDR